MLLTAAWPALRRYPQPATLRRITMAALIAQIGIVVSGGAVRLTSSGLGCPTWPHCTGSSLVPVRDAAHPAVHQAIEFGNRMLTTLVLIAGISVVVAIRRSVPRQPALVRLAWLQPLGVLAQIVLGGITVLVDLHPAAVAAHFLLSMGIIAAAAELYFRTSDSGHPLAATIGAVRREVTLLSRALVPLAAVLIAVGTLVTGSGPHAGDRSAPRFGFSIARVAMLHADVVWITVAVSFGIWITLRVSDSGPTNVATASAAARDLLVVELAQGFLGYLQYFTGDPAFVVGAHMLGAAVFWVCVLRLAHAVARVSGRPQREGLAVQEHR